MSDLRLSPVAPRAGDLIVGDNRQDLLAGDNHQRVIELVARWRVQAAQFTNPIVANVWRQAATELAEAFHLSPLEIKP